MNAELLLSQVLLMKKVLFCKNYHFGFLLYRNLTVKRNCSPLENIYFLISFKYDFGLNWSECKINIY